MAVVLAVSIPGLVLLLSERTPEPGERLQAPAPEDPRVAATDHTLF
jgi:hypothetical protein